MRTCFHAGQGVSQGSKSRICWVICPNVLLQAPCPTPDLFDSELLGGDYREGSGFLGGRSTRERCEVLCQYVEGLTA